MIGTILIFLLIFFIIVLGHEFGHFLIAKVNGIRVNEFTIGMGPRLSLIHISDNSLRRFAILSILLFKHCLVMTLSSISAISSQLPCFGV